MPIGYTVDPESGAALSRGYGVVGVEDVLNVIAKYVGDQRLAVPHRELFDIREVEPTEYDVDHEGVRTVTGFVESVGDRFADGRVAYVATADMPFGIGRVFEVFAESLGIELRAFRDIETARQWLGIGRSPLPSVE